MHALLWMALSSQANAVEASDWQDTRWQLSVESVLPVEVNLQARNNAEFILKALQMRTTVACGSAEPVGKGLLISCTFEDVAIQAIPHGEAPNERELENSKKVIDDVVDRMVGSQLEVAFNKHGRVTRVDVIMPEGRNVRDRQSRERIRQLATDLAMGWSLKRPKEWEGTWPESNSPLFRAPGVAAAGGTSNLAHAAADADGRTIVQSQGNGIASAYYTPWELEGAGKIGQTQVESGAALSGGGGMQAASATGERIVSGTVAGGASAIGATPETRNFNVGLRSVAVIQDDLIVERVWSVTGSGTNSSVGAFQGTNLWYNGRIRRLNGDEKPDLGPTQLVNAPGVQVEGLTPWTPMDQ